METEPTATTADSVAKKASGWRAPLGTTGIGLVSFPLSFFVGGVGPCGPSSGMGLVLMLVSFVCLPVGILWSAGRYVFQLIRKAFPLLKTD